MAFLLGDRRHVHCAGVVGPSAFVSQSIKVPFPELPDREGSEFVLQSCRLGLYDLLVSSETAAGQHDCA